MLKYKCDLSLLYKRIYEYYIFDNAFYLSQQFNDRKVKFASFNMI